MGLVRKVNVDSVAGGKDGTVDISATIRQAVTDEIERRRLESLQTTQADDEQETAL